MIDQFKQWFIEIKDNAIGIKKNAARLKGDETQWKKEVWTSPTKNREIKAKFALEGTKLGYKSRPSQLTGAREWLYDFVWRAFDEENNLKQVVLTMEIEVSDYHFRYDFNKLLQSDSTYKVMVFQQKSEHEIQNTFHMLKNIVHSYHSKIEAEYLFVGWSTSLNEFFFSNMKSIN